MSSIRLPRMFLACICLFSTAALAQDQPVSQTPEIQLPPSSANTDPDASSEPSEEQQQAYDAAMSEFEQVRIELAKAIADQRAIYLQYVNREDRTSAAKQRYVQQRAEVRALMDQLYRKALAVTRTGVINEVIVRYIVTTVQHRVAVDYYDADTFEGAAKMLDAGQNLQLLFAGAARSAVVIGRFDVARQLFEILVESENVEEIDKILYANLDRYKEQWEAEQSLLSQASDKSNLPTVKLRTTQGDVLLELFVDQAPTTVANFIQLVDQGFYDGLDFYQVIDHALALTGDPSNVGEGTSGKFIKDEHDRIDKRYAFRGSLVMVKIPLGETGEFLPNSASSQFAIPFLPVSSISDQQTVFGRVIEGMDVVSRFRRVDPNKEQGKEEIVLPADSIIEASVIRRPETLPQPEYMEANPAAR